MTKNIPEQKDRIKDQRQRVFHDWLYVSYPNVFNAKKPLPLTKGIAKTLAEQLPENVTKTDLRTAIGWYCRRMGYLQALLEQTHRINLDGETVEEILSDEKKAAKELLKKIQRKKQKNCVSKRKGKHKV